MRFPRSAVSFVATLALSTVCAAGAHAQARIDTGFAFSTTQLGVRDLTPADGRTAGYQLLPWSYTELDVNASFGPDPDHMSSMSDWRSAILGTATDLTLADSRFSTAIATDGGLGGLAGAATFHGPVVLAPIYAHVFALGAQRVGIVVAAHTELSLTTDYRMTVARDGDDGGTQYGSAYVHAGLSLEDVSIDDDSSFFAGPGEPGGELAGRLHLSYANDSDSAMTVYLGLTGAASSFSYVPVSSVPEPQTWAMLAGGLLLLGRRLRPRR